MLDGSIPAELGSLPALEILTLEHNNLTGCIPSELGDLINIERLYFNNNQITGGIPASLGDLSTLQWLKGEYNNLLGCYPQNLANLCGQATVTFNNNPLLIEEFFTNFCFNDSSGQCALELAVKTYLQGPLDTSTDLMDDDLRQAGLLPTSFGGSNITSSDVFNITGDDAIVDWVTVELRSTSSPTTTALSRPALLQRDGDVVDVDGKTALNFDTLAADTYHIVVKHRNHLGIMSNMTVTVN